ncbi:tetratricopeptide repeat protein [Microscilla marina]|uniref:tetratricopeptide repeat protein n=1 Tax=Microscilla marina TaxID=1027 RepID=UPI0005D47775|nr:tetratricopeptide repeat protein [Microscilla marina]
MKVLPIAWVCCIADTKKVCLCLFVTVLYCLVLATAQAKSYSKIQRQIEQLTAQLRQASSVPQKVKLLYQLGELHKFEYKKAIQYYQKGGALATKAHDIAGVAQGHVLQGKLHLSYRSFDKAWQQFKKGEATAQKHQLVAAHIDCLNGIASVLIEKNKQHKARTLYHKALKLAQQLNDPERICYTNIRIGEFHRLQKNYDSAFEYLAKALKTAQHYQMVALEYEGLMVKSTAYTDLGQFDRVEQLAHEALQVVANSNNSHLLAGAYNNLAIANTCLKKYDLAIGYYTKALRIKQKTKDNGRLVILYHNIADLYRKSLQYDLAITYFKKSLDYTQKRGDVLATGVMLRNIGEVYYLKQAYDQAEKYLKQSEVKVQQASSLFETSATYQLLARNYAALNNFRQAYYYQAMHKKADDSIFNNEKSESIAKLEQHYKEEQKQKAIALLKKETNLQRQKTTFQRKLRNIAVVGLLLAVLVVVLLYNRYQLRHKILQQKSLALTQENARHKAEGQRMEIEQKLKQEENKRLKLDLEYKNRELATSTLLMHHKNEVLTNIQGELSAFQHQVPPKLSSNIQSIKKIIQENNHLEEEWEHLKIHFNQVHPNFFGILQQRFSHLSQHDLRLCAYIRIGLTNKEIARILHVEFRSVQVAKYRLKKKMGLTKTEDLSQFVQQL